MKSAVVLFAMVLQTALPVVAGMTFSSAPFDLDTRQVAGRRDAKPVETIFASADWQTDVSATDCLARVSHRFPNGQESTAYVTWTSGVESFDWEAERAAPGEHVFTHEILRGETVVDRQTATFVVAEPVLQMLWIIGPNVIRSECMASYSCVGWMSDSRFVENLVAHWELVEPVPGVTLDSSGILSASGVTSPCTARLRAVATVDAVTLTQEMAVSVEPGCLTLSPAELSVGKERGTYEIAVTCPGAWQATADCDWIGFADYTETGVGDGPVRIVVQANGAAAERSATVKVVNGALRADLTVTQAGVGAGVAVAVKFIASEADRLDFASREYVTGSTYGKLPVAKRRGYAFAGWWTQPDGAGARITASTEVLPEALRLYARWTEMTVAYALNGSLTWANASPSPWEPDYDVSVDGEVSMRSGAVGADGNSPLTLTTVGNGVLNFWWKSFGGALELLVDGVQVRRIVGKVDWRAETVKVDVDKEHTFMWIYSGEGGCGWLDRVTWLPDYAAGEVHATSASGHSAPERWLAMHSLSAVDLDADSDGDGVCNWAEYVAGSDPNDASSKFILKIEFDGSVPKVTVIPDLGESRTYELEGKTNLSDENWERMDESKHRFFRARVLLTP